MLMFLVWSVYGETWFIVLHWQIYVYSVIMWVGSWLIIVAMLWLSLNPVQTWQSICHKLWSFFSWLNKLWDGEWHLKTNMPCGKLNHTGDHHPFYVNNDDFIEQFFLHILFTNLQIFYDVVKGPVFLSDYSVCTRGRPICVFQGRYRYRLLQIK